MISSYSDYKTMLITLISIVTLVFVCHGDDSGNFSLPHFRLKNAAVTSIELYQMIEDNEKINLNDSRSLSLNSRILELLHFVWFCRDQNQKPITSVTLSEKLIPFFESFYWLEDALSHGRQAYIERISQVYQFKIYLLAFRNCMDVIKNDNNGLFLCIYVEYPRTLTFTSNNMFNNYDEFNKAYQNTKNCGTGVIPDSLIENVHTCIKGFNDLTYKFELEYNKKLLEMQKNLNLINPIEPEFHGTSDVYKNIPKEVLLPHNSLKFRIISPQELTSVIEENENIDLRNNKELAVSYRIVELLHFIWFKTDGKELINENIDLKYLVSFFESYYWLDDSAALGISTNGYKDRLTQVAKFKTELFKLRICLSRFTVLKDCIFENYFQNAHILAYANFIDFKTMVIKYNKTKSCMTNGRDSNTIREYHMCLKLFNDKTRRYELDYNEKLVKIQQDLGIQDIIIPTVHGTY